MKQTIAIKHYNLKGALNLANSSNFLSGMSIGVVWSEALSTPSMTK